MARSFTLAIILVLCLTETLTFPSGGSFGGGRMGGGGGSSFGGGRIGGGSFGHTSGGGFRPGGNIGGGMRPGAGIGGMRPGAGIGGMRPGNPSLGRPLPITPPKLNPGLGRPGIPGGRPLPITPKPVPGIGRPNIPGRPLPITPKPTPSPRPIVGRPLPITPKPTPSPRPIPPKPIVTPPKQPIVTPKPIQPTPVKPVQPTPVKPVQPTPKPVQPTPVKPVQPTPTPSPSPRPVQTPVAPSTKPNPGAYTPTNVYQANPAWKDLKLGNGQTTIQKGGCVVSSLAAMAERSGLKINGATPNTLSMNNWLKDNGGFAKGSSEVNTAVMSKLGYSVGPKLEGNNLQSSIQQGMNQGKSILLNVGGHQVLATGKDATGYTVIDPGHQYKNHYTFDQVKSARIYSR